MLWLMDVKTLLIGQQLEEAFKSIISYKRRETNHVDIKDILEAGILDLTYQGKYEESKHR